MSDLCVICMCNTSESVCYTCSAKTHIKCFYTYLRESGSKNECPACRSKKVLQKRNTRLRISLKTISKMIDDHQACVSLDDQLASIARIFDVILGNKNLYLYNRRLNNMIIHKIEEMHNYMEYEAEKYSQKFFSVTFDDLIKKYR